MDRSVRLTRTTLLRPGLLGLAALIASAGAASAMDPVAMVEQVTGSVAGVEAMDYLAAGKVIRLGPQVGLVISYLHSCVRETITGGMVKIGTAKSQVTGGSVRREKVECDGGRLHLTAEQASKSGVVVFRAPPKSGLPPVQRTLYGLSPVIDLGGGGRLVIERLDRPEAPIALDIAAEQLVRGTFFDLAKSGRSLTAGGIYRASSGGRSVVFKIDRFAEPGQAPLATRLLRL